MKKSTKKEEVKKELLLSEIADTNMIDIDEAICDDKEIEEAIINYQKGKLLENEGKKLSDEAKKILDERMYKRKIHKIKTSSVVLSYTEYTKSSFNEKLFKELNPQLHEKFIATTIQKRYSIKPVIEVNIDNK